MYDEREYEVCAINVYDDEANYYMYHMCVVN